MEQERKRKRRITLSESALCAKCTALTGTIEGLRAACSNQGYLHWSSKRELQESFRLCRFCELVWNSRSWKSTKVIGPLRTFIQHKKSQDGDSSKPSCDMHPLRGATFQRIVIKDERDQDQRNLVFLYVSASRNDLSFSFIETEPVQSEVGSLSTFEHTRRWLHTCRTLHTMCSAAAGSVMPTRLLDVGCDELTSSVCLWTVKTIKCDYIAFSYCWGTSSQPVTIKNNLNSRQTHLDLKTLPQSIQDAIVVTRNLGVRFLWVDALCIVQDDDEERQAEIKAMGAIYKNALLTISAASTSNVFDGFLRTRPHPDLLDVPLWIAPNIQGTIKLAKWQYIDLFAEPLHRRGWTFQEYVISPRVLLFCKYEVLWRCATHQIVPIQRSHLSYGNDLALNIQTFNQETTSANQRAKIWHAVVQNYSGRKFSDPVDRLNALVGIATELSMIWQDTYLFGLWSTTMIQDLAWHRQPKQDTFTECNRSALPSWSWYSKTFAVQMWPAMAIADARMLDPEEILQPLFTINEVSERSAKISISARALDASRLTETGSRLFQIVTMDADGGDKLPPGSSVALLGYKKEKAGRSYSALCLVLHSLGEGMFKRTGYTRTWHFSWETVARLEFFLV